MVYGVFASIFLAAASAQAAELGAYPVNPTLHEYCVKVQHSCHDHNPLPVPLSPSLPQVLVMGDSVSMGWTPELAHQLNGIMEVQHIGQKTQHIQNCSGVQPDSGCGMANGGDSCRGYLCTTNSDKACSGEGCWWRRQPNGGQWDVVLMNFGLHDVETGKYPDHEVPLDHYKQLLPNITATMLGRTKRLVWVSTTPVSPVIGSRGRRESDIEAYNAAAAQIMEDQKVQICDLHGFVMQHCGANYKKCDWQRSPPHFPGQYSHLASFVSTCLNSAIGEKMALQSSVVV